MSHIKVVSPPEGGQASPERIRVVDLLNVVDLMNMADQQPVFCSLDHTAELPSDYGDPLSILMRKEQAQDGPIALCVDSTTVMPIHWHGRI